MKACAAAEPTPRGRAERDLLARKQDAAIGLEQQFGLGQEEGADLEAAVVRRAVRRRAAQDVVARLGARREREGARERAQGRQFHHLAAQRPAERVRERDAPFLAGAEHVAVALGAAQHRAPVHGLAGPVRRPIGDDVAARAERRRTGQAAEREVRGGRAEYGRGVDAQVLRRAALVAAPIVTRDAVRAGHEFDHLRTARLRRRARDHQPHARGAGRARHVHREHHQLLARALHQQVEVAAQHQRGGAQVLAADRDRPRARAFDRDLDLADERRERRVILHCPGEGLRRRDQVEIEAADALVREVLAEIGLEIQRVDLDLQRVEVAGLGAHRHGLAAAEHALGADRQPVLDHALQPCARLPSPRTEVAAPVRGDRLGQAA